ncbi:MAG: PD40 domain-containing protein [Saprospiraceae bacterium]|nr:PD40 domain-containing protein [Saprospiraceae bacterium]
MNFRLLLQTRVPILILCLWIHEGWSQDKSSKSPENPYYIVYNIRNLDTVNDDWEIMRVNMDGTNQKNLTHNKDVAWTYYGYKDKIFFISDRDSAYRNFYLYQMDPDGKNIRKISDLRLEDSWMSSRKKGSEMVVSGRIGKEIRFQLFLIDIQTGTYKQLTNDTGAYFRDPCFSKDGKKIVFSHKKNKRDRNETEELFMMNADGSGLMQLTHYPKDNISYKDYGYKAGAARWHPTENFISYISRQDGRHGIYAVTPDGKKQWKLYPSENAAGWHDWSPDGKWLAFNSSDPEENQFEIQLMSWKTKELKQLTNSEFKIQMAPIFVKK